MKQVLEKISILSLSTLLVSTFAVSPALPAMIADLAGQGYTADQVAFLITVTSLAIMTGLLANKLWTRYLSESQIIALGLVLVATGGSLPFFLPLYWPMFAGRLVLGLGLGMINARAINLVSQRYQGQERLQMMGWRGSAEVLGSASLTALVGLLLPLGWSVSFAIYLIALVVLALYWFFVPKADEPKREQEKGQALPKAYIKRGLGLALVAGLVININTALTLQIPIRVTEGQLGTATQASWVLSAMMLMGILAGLAFRGLVTRLGHWLLPAAVLAFSSLVFLASSAQNLTTLALGAVLSGFCYSIVLTLVFNQASADTPKPLLNQMMTLVLMGCNLGGASSSLVPSLLNQLLPDFDAFAIYAGVGLLIGLLLMVREWQKS